MKRSLLMIAVAVTTAVTVGVTARMAQAANPEITQDIGAPAPPRVDVATIPAGSLHLGMTVSDVTRIMGNPAKVRNHVAGETGMTGLDFPAGPIPTKVTLADGKVSAIALDVFQADKNDLPSFTRQAWAGMSSSGVRRALGDPSYVRHHAFFGIELDQLVFRRSDEPEVSVFLVADRVVAKAVGQNIPAGIFEVHLPSSPPTLGKDATRCPQVGMTESEIQALYGVVKFRVDYVFNGQPASRVILERRATGSFTSFTFVDGILTEFEELGRLPGNVTLEGR